MPSLAKQLRYFQTLGVGAALRFRLAKVLDGLADRGLAPASRAPMPLRIKGIAHPIWMRRGSSDIHVVYQVFVCKEYDVPLDRDPGDVRLIIDCGANVGYTSVFLLNKFPNARIIAVEPDPDNLAVCRKNFAPYGDRVELVEGGVWSHEADLKLVRPEGREFEWAIALREVEPGETPTLRATSIPALLERSGLPAVDLLKIDIEGAEEVIFAANCDWLARVHNLVIELHGESREEVFFRTMGNYRFRQSVSGELTACTGITPAPSDSLASRGG